MIRIIIMYLAIGGIITTNVCWDKLIWYYEDQHYSVPLMVAIGIGSCIITPICFIIGIILGLFELFKGN